MTNSQKELVGRIRKRRSVFFGHVKRMGGLECVALTGRLDGERGKGRPREKYRIVWIHVMLEYRFEK